MSYLRLSRLALLVCLVIWCVVIGLGLLGLDPELGFLAGIVFSVLLGLLAANALIAQLFAKFRNTKVAKHG